MVVCNICRKNKLSLDEMENNFTYVCKACWDKMKIYIDDVEINKELMY